MIDAREPKIGATATATGQQWDRPNGWAPLQYLAIEGLNFHGERDLAREIADRWIRKNALGYAATGVLVEKYNVEQGRTGVAAGAANIRCRSDSDGPTACSPS